MSRLMYYDEEAHQFFPMPDEQPELMRSTTNADRIRAMSDEELAERIETIADCNHCPILEKVQKKPIRETCRGEKAVSRYSCMKHWLDWLREESTT